MKSGRIYRPPGVFETCSWTRRNWTIIESSAGLVKSLLATAGRRIEPPGPRHKPIQAMYQPLHKFAEALPLVLQGVQLDGLVACPAQPLYLLRRAFTQALQRLDIAPGVLD